MNTRTDVEEQLTNLVAHARRYSTADPRYLAAHAKIDQALSVWEATICEELIAAPSK